MAVGRSAGLIAETGNLRRFQADLFKAIAQKEP
jgi:uncharacterized membrane protein YoaK (UPF0700 family)